MTFDQWLTKMFTKTWKELEIEYIDDGIPYGEINEEYDNLYREYLTSKE